MAHSADAARPTCLVPRYAVRIGTDHGSASTPIPEPSSLPLNPWGCGDMTGRECPSSESNGPSAMSRTALALEVGPSVRETPRHQRSSCLSKTRRLSLDVDGSSSCSAYACDTSSPLKPAITRHPNAHNTRVGGPVVRAAATPLSG